MRIALKVDVDTFDGMRDGIPNFLKLFKRLNVRASFYIPFGPDQSGRAVLRVFTKKGFIKKMFRTNALKLYGIKTMLRGTLLPAPMIGGSFPDLVKEIEREGHETGIHGFNHVEWQDRLPAMSEDRIRKHYLRGIEGYEKAMGKKPQCFAAPAWLCTETSVRVMDEMKFHYASDTRGKNPFYPRMNGAAFKTLQVPSTLPTLDELLAWDGITVQNVNERLTASMKQSGISTHVHSIHTEVEGTAFFDSFSRWVESLKKDGIEFVTLREIADEALADPKTPTGEIKLGLLPGRAGPVACQQ